jgi:hypothetical protein
VGGRKISRRFVSVTECHIGKNQGDKKLGVQSVHVKMSQGPSVGERSVKALDKQLADKQNVSRLTKIICKMAISGL